MGVDWFSRISSVYTDRDTLSDARFQEPQNSKNGVIMILKRLLSVGLALILAGCGNGYEGEYSEHVGSSVEFLNAFAQVAGDKTVVIGRNYIDSEGIRTEYKDIFVRDSGSQKYLILKNENDSEEAWKIVDEDTLIKSSGLVSITLKRIKP